MLKKMGILKREKEVLSVERSNGDKSVYSFEYTVHFSMSCNLQQNLGKINRKSGEHE